MSIQQFAIGIGLLMGLTVLALIFSAYANPLLDIYLDSWSLC